MNLECGVVGDKYPVNVTKRVVQDSRHDPLFFVKIPVDNKFKIIISNSIIGNYYMEHRHINIKQNQWNVAIVHSIWERGLEEDICELIRAVRKDPRVAHAVRRAIPHSKVYGWPKFFKMYVEKIYGKEH